MASLLVASMGRQRPSHRANEEDKQLFSGVRVGRRASEQNLDHTALARLQGARLVLRRPQPGDAPRLYSYASDPRSSRYLAWRPHRDEAESRAFLQGCIEAWEGGQRLCWVIETGGGVVGMIEAKLKGRNAGVGYVLSPHAWGEGYASEALALLSGALFRYSPVSAIWALCVTDNSASARVLEKCGYGREGLLSRYLPCPNLDGGRHDVWRYVRYRLPSV
jgi:ribosomal-protein-alanine N-acetyltransferase